MRLILLFLVLTVACAAGKPPATPPVKLVRPALPTLVLPGEVVEVAVQAPAGSRLKLLLPNGDSAPLPFDGELYRRTVRVDEKFPLWVGGEGWSEQLGTLELVPSVPPVATVNQPEAVFRSGPDDAFDRYDPLALGVRSTVTGRRGDWIRLSAGGWVHADDLVISDETAPARPVLRAVKLTEEGAVFSLDARVALQVKEEPGRLALHLPETGLAMGEAAYEPEAAWAREVTLHPGPQHLVVDLQLTRNVSGYTADWDNNTLTLRIAPPPPRTLRGLHVILDAGHGGGDTGAVGEGGTVEKALNLAVARHVEQRLEQAGATVTMTREADLEVAGPEASAAEELGARVTAGQRAGGDVFLSIHHNARPDPAEGKVAHGVDVYYYRPQSLALARALAEPLARATGEPAHRALWRSFNVIRQTHMPAVLIELNYLSNPDVERSILLHPDYPEKVARGIIEGLEHYLKM